MMVNGKMILNMEKEQKFYHQEKNSKQLGNKIKSMENQFIPDNFDYESIISLSNESKQKLMTVRPETVAQASRIAGVRASDISLLCIKIKQHNVPRETLQYNI